MYQMQAHQQARKGGFVWNRTPYENRSPSIPTWLSCLVQGIYLGSTIFPSLEGMDWTTVRYLFQLFQANSTTLLEDSLACYSIEKITIFVFYCFSWNSRIP